MSQTPLTREMLGTTLDAVRYRLNRGLRVLLLAYCALLLYGTLWPLQFSLQPRDPTDPHARVEWFPFSYRCPDCGWDWKDKLLNLAMFVPFGFLTGGQRAAAKTVLANTVYPTVLGFCLSLGIETIQYFLPARTPTASDVLMNTLGAGVGALLAWFARLVWESKGATPS